MQRLKRSSIEVLVAVIAAAGLVGLAAQGAAAQTWGQYGFTVTPLPVDFFAQAVNDAGQVAGDYSMGGGYEAALWDGSSAELLGTLGGNSSSGVGINSSGQVAGYSYLGGNASYHAFLYGAGSGMQDLGTLGGSNSAAYGINSSGQVTGYSYLIGDATTHAFLYSAGSGMQDLGTLGGSSSSASGINSLGQVVGSSYLSGNASYDAFLYGAGSGMQDLGTLGGNSSYGLGVNSSGQVAGFSYLSGNASYHAFLYGAGSGMQDLGYLGGGVSSVANRISDAGVVAGYSLDAAGTYTAALWQNGAPYSLADIIDPSDPGWSFSNAWISAGGTILAYGTNSAVNAGAGTYIVLKPNGAPSTVTPEPASVLLLATGLIGLFGLGAVRRRHHLNVA